METFIPTELTMRKMKLQQDLGSRMLYKKNHIPWKQASGIVREVINGLAVGTLHPVDASLLKDLRNDFTEAHSFFKAKFDADPYFIRIEGAVVAFDSSRLPKIIQDLKEMIDTGKITEEPEEVRAFLVEHPDQIRLLHKEWVRPLKVWINRQLFVFETAKWNMVNPVEEWLQSAAFFNDQSIWK